MTGVCVVCNKASILSCSSCGKDEYCNREHQTIHWPYHRRNCVPFEITDDRASAKGKRIIATRDLYRGEILFDEEPILWGPLFSPNDLSPTCVSCCTVTNSMLHDICSQCGSPVCGPECEKNPIHSNNECMIFRENKLKWMFSSWESSCWHQNPFASIILLIRGGELKSQNREEFKELQSLRYYSQDLCFDANEDKRAKSVMSYLKTILPSKKLDLPEEIHKRIYMICRLNAFTYNEPVSDDPQDNDQKRSSKKRSFVVYNKASRLNYSCVPNCSWTICPEDNWKIRIRVSVPVKKGEELTISCDRLKGSFQGTLFRQQRLQKLYGMCCECPRCQDPTELEAYSSAVTCTSPCCTYRVNNNEVHGYYFPGNSFEDGPEAVWKCDFCCNTIQQKDIMQIVSGVKSSLEQTMLRSCDPVVRIQEFKIAMTHFMKYNLHPKNGILAEATYKMLKTFRNLPVCTRELMHTQISWLIYILDLKGKISPGLSLSRAQTLNELSNALKTKLDNFGLTLPPDELTMNYILFFETSIESFEFYMDDLYGIEETMNLTALDLFDMMIEVKDTWGPLVNSRFNEAHIKVKNIHELFWDVPDALEFRNILKLRSSQLLKCIT